MKLDRTGVERWQGETMAGFASRPRAIIGGTAPDPARWGMLTADGQAATPLEQEALLGINDLVESNFLERCQLVMECVGRLRFDGGHATGFLVGPGLLMTNHHVLGTADAARGAAIEFGYRYDIAGQLPAATESFALDPDAFFVADPALDFAVVGVAPRSAGGRDLGSRCWLRLIAAPGKAKAGDHVTIVQHPDGAPMRVALRENQVTRLEPGEPFLWYRADTAHGSSGAPLFNDQFQLVGLHASGRIRRDADGRYALRKGGWAETLDGLGEDDVDWEANVGFRASRIVVALLDATRAHWPGSVAVIEAAMRGGDALAAAVGRAKTNGHTPDRVMPVPTMRIDSSPVIPIEVRVIVEGGTPRPAAVAHAAPSPLEAEASRARIPAIHDGLAERPGFDPALLGLPGDAAAPGPRVTAAGQRMLAPLLDGDGHELRYRHFSVWMHKERRLALYTSANVDWRARTKLIEARPTTRDALNGFPEGSDFPEAWALDTRLDPRFQLPDLFYTADRGAFDKGHVVRRDDVCWGDSFAEVQMANGDTFHVTNCSPQTAAFNRGVAGRENWGDLETHIQKATRRDGQRAIVHAGPVFAPDDRWFAGTDAGGAARVQIPSRYWKIVVVNGPSGLEAYGFVLKQDVRAITEKEFYVTEKWLGALTPLAEIEKLLRGWLSLDALIPHDRHDEAERTAIA